MGIDGMVAIGPATEEGRNVVYGDGHVEWLAPAAFEAELQRANERRRKNDRTTPIDVYDLPIATP
jgi:prepilin-type processing-associated H-X9-DG protein